MYDVAQVNRTQPPDWAPTAEQVGRALRNDAYPSAGRVAVGAAGADSGKAA